MFFEQADGNFEFSPNKIHKSISPQLSHQRHHRLVQQRSTPSNIGRTKFQMPRQPSEETMMRPVKPILTRGLGFSGNDSGRLDSGTRESSLGSKFTLNFQSHEFFHIFFHIFSLKTMTMHTQHIH
jgi:hypothetical protein